MVLQSTSARISDGREVTIRPVDRRRDLGPLLAFLSSLPPEVRNTLPYDVRDPRILETRLAQVDDTHHWRVVAMLDGLIVSEATLDREPYGWSRHVGVFRAVVHPELELRGLRHLMCERLVGVAREAGIERLTTDVLADQGYQARVLERLGFVREVTRKGWAKGLDGRAQDLIVLTADLEAVWRQLEQHLAEMDTYFPGISGAE